MKPTSKLFASIAFFALANVPMHAQSPERTEARQRASAGITTSTEQSTETQQQQTADTQNLAIVDAYIQQNPGSAGLAVLAATPSVAGYTATQDGNYLIKVPLSDGATDTVEALGPSSVLDMLAGSIQASTDPVQQAALYQSMYSQYVTLYQQVCGGAGACTGLAKPSTLTSPSSLQNAPLDTIYAALSTLAAQGPKIINQVPVTPVSDPVKSCTTDIGASLLATNGTYTKGITAPPTLVFGDQTNSCSSKPAANGILQNYTWPNENLLTCVKKQGNRGTCHIFAATSAMEELIARDTGDFVNLSEQDFEENEALWTNTLLHAGGNPKTDLENAKNHQYSFAYEYQWDYNPAYGSSNYSNTCEFYPTSLEPGCSNSTPEAPGCNALAGVTSCAPATLSGPRSPYQSDGANSLWADPHKYPGLMSGYVILTLAFNNTVVLGFNLSPGFSNEVHGYGSYTSLDSGSGAGHVVHVVGYADTTTLEKTLAAKGLSLPSGLSSTSGYFIIKNSWGTCAGDQGYYYMPVEYLQYRANGVFAVASETH